MCSFLRLRLPQLPAGFVVTTIVGGLVTPPARNADGEARTPVFTVKNESDQARTINVAGFLVVAVENAFFLISA